MLALRRGTTRVVLAIGPVVLKFAHHRAGVRCNLFEADLYSRTTSERREMLCPVLACVARGWVLVARSAEPLTEAEAKLLRVAHGFPDWDYDPRDGESEPFEYKASDWGWLDNRLVALDYSTPVLP
jgi:hypothetical protein